MRLTWKTWQDVCAFLEEHGAGDQIKGIEIPWSEASEDVDGEGGPYGIGLDVVTINGNTARVRHGDWIIAEDTPGLFYPCAPEVFAHTYEPYDDTESELVMGSAGPEAR